MISEQNATGIESQSKSNFKNQWNFMVASNTLHVYSVSPMKQERKYLCAHTCITIGHQHEECIENESKWTVTRITLDNEYLSTRTFLCELVCFRNLHITYVASIISVHIASRAKKTSTFIGDKKIATNKQKSFRLKTSERRKNSHASLKFALNVNIISLAEKKYKKFSHHLIICINFVFRCSYPRGKSGKSDYFSFGLWNRTVAMNSIQLMENYWKRNEVFDWVWHLWDFISFHWRIEI